MSQSRNWARQALMDMREKGEGFVTVELRGRLDAQPSLKNGDRLRFIPEGQTDIQPSQLLLVAYKGRARLAVAWGRKGSYHGVMLQRRYVGQGSVKVLALVEKVA